MIDSNQISFWFGNGKRNISAPASSPTTAPPAASRMWAITPSWSGPTRAKWAAPKPPASAKTFWSAAMPKPATGAANARSENGHLGDQGTGFASGLVQVQDAIFQPDASLVIAKVNCEVSRIVAPFCL